MVIPAVEQELHRRLGELPHAQQQQVLDFARFLATSQPRGLSRDDLLAIGGTISPEDRAAMTEAIKDCERVDENEW
jgi:hypothetical protein